jgi:hypothetical protein
VVSTCGVTFAMFGRCFRNPAADIAARVLLAVISFVTMFHPNDTLVWASGLVTLPALVWGIWRHRLIAAPKAVPIVAAQPASLNADDLAPLLAEAKRDVG